MDILAPINRAEEVEPLARAGATEVYCAVLSERWRKRYTHLGGVSREMYTRSSLPSYDELRKALTIAHDLGLRVNVAYNQDFYSAAQFTHLVEEVDEAIAAEADALIVADLGLMSHLHDNDVGIDIHVSTISAVFNAQAARFYQRLGASRVILPHHLSIKEIADIAQAAPDITLEGFVLNARCPHVEGLCTYLHGFTEVRHKSTTKGMFALLSPRLGSMRAHLVRAMRHIPKTIQYAGPIARVASSHLCLNSSAVQVEALEGSDELAAAVQERFGLQWAPNWGGSGCGICGLGLMRDAGVTVVKIQGRIHPTSKKVDDIILVRRALEELEGSEDSTAYMERCRILYRDLYGWNCSAAECYWPEVVR